jgi:hypothetical protein
MPSSGMAPCGFVRIDVSEESIASIITVARSFHRDNGGDTFLRNVGSYKSHAASYPIRRHSSRFLFTREYEYRPCNALRTPLWRMLIMF